MAVGLVSNTVSASTTTSTLTITKPTGLANGHVLLACITSDSTVPTAPSGWVQFAGGPHASASWNNNLYYKVVTNALGEPASYGWTVGTVGPAAGCINAWSGVDTADVIGAFAEQETTTSTEPNTGPDLVVTSSEPRGRLMYVRAVRDSPGGGTATAIDMTTATSGVTRRSSIGEESTSGNTSYSISLFSNDSNYNGAATYPGLAISASPASEDHNYEATFCFKALDEPADGPIVATLPALTSSFAGTREIPAGPIVSSLPPLAFSGVGTAAPPSGPMVATLPKLTSSFAGSGIGGPLSSELPSLSIAVAAGAEPTGPIVSTLPSLSFFGDGETRVFGENVILVDPEKRAFRITDDDMVAIYPSQVTQE